MSTKKCSIGEEPIRHRLGQLCFEETLNVINIVEVNPAAALKFKAMNTRDRRFNVNNLAGWHFCDCVCSESFD